MIRCSLISQNYEILARRKDIRINLDESGKWAVRKRILFQIAVSDALSFLFLNLNGFDEKALGLYRTQIAEGIDVAAFFFSFFGLYG